MHILANFLEDDFYAATCNGRPSNPRTHCPPMLGLLNQNCEKQPSCAALQIFSAALQIFCAELNVVNFMPNLPDMN